MKRKIAGMLIGTLLITGVLSGCGSTNAAPTSPVETTTAEASSEAITEEETTAEETTTADLIMITDSGTIDDKSFNQSIWEGVATYAAENGMETFCYQPESSTTEVLSEYVDKAVENNAKLVVCTGALFEETVFEAQKKYPDTSFIIVDGAPHSGDYAEDTIEKNVMSIMFDEEQSGFLAGYAAVKEGYTKLGFLGGAPLPGVVRYGYGFVQGADAAATEDEKKIEMNYHYTGSFAATPEAEAMSASWYQQGTEVIFACGGSLGSSVMTAAEDTDKAMVIGVDCDQSAESDRVLTSAMKNLKEAVYDGVQSYFDGNFAGGTKTVYSAENKGVGLPFAASGFQTFTKEEYDALYQKLNAGEYTLQPYETDISPKALNVSNTEISFAE